MKRLSEKQMKKNEKAMPTVEYKGAYVPFAILALLLLGTTIKQPLKADTGRGLFGGALTGAAIGGIAGGGKGAAIGTVTGAALGGIIGSASDDSRGRDPYRQLDRERRKMDKLQNRLDRTTNPNKRTSLMRQINTQRARVADLERRLNAGPGQAPYGYQPGYVRNRM